MHRAFGIDVLACAHCGGRLRLIATLHDPAVIRKILAHLALATRGRVPAPPHPSPAPPRPDRIGSRGAADAVVPAPRGGIRADSAGVRRPIDGGGLSGLSMSLTRAGSLDPRGGRSMCTVAAAPGAASVRVWQITSGGRRPPGRRPPPQACYVAYAPPQGEAICADPACKREPFGTSRMTGPCHRKARAHRKLYRQSRPYALMGTKRSHADFRTETGRSSADYICQAYDCWSDTNSGKAVR